MNRPNRLSEFHTHVAAFNSLVKTFGQDRVLGEYTIAQGNRALKKRGGRVDLALLSRDLSRPILLVEVKPDGFKSTRTSGRPKQVQRYEALARCPAILCVGLKQARLLGHIASRMACVQEDATA